MRRVRADMGLTNLKLMVPFCRTPAEGRRVVELLAEHGLRRGEDGLEVYVMCEIPSNVILAREFAEIFDGFSIGSNDLTQLTLGLDRDSALVAPLFDERNPAVLSMIADVIARARAAGRKIGICGQAPSDYPEFARFLVREGIDSISLNPDAVVHGFETIAAAEREQPRLGDVTLDHPARRPRARRALCRHEENVMPRKPSIMVREWMNRRVFSIGPDARLSEAATLMRRRKVRHLPVVERGGRLVGMVSARDLRQALFAPSVQDGLENLRGVLDGLAVRDIMASGVIGVRAATSIREAARLMYERKIGALPVVERNLLVGILTETDVLEGFQRVLGATPTSA